MNLFFKWLYSLKTANTPRNKKIKTAIKSIVGKAPLNIDLYILATKHVSVAKENHRGFKESNERLEYLGDAILGSVVAEYLFKKFPFQDEGFLTEIRSRIVNRESLNTLGRKIGLDKLIEFDANRKTNLSHRSLHGDTMEALVGAVYLDRGFKDCKRFIIKKLLIPYYDLEQIVRNNPNYKSRIIEWAQKESKSVEFKLLEIQNLRHHKEFIVQLHIDGEPLGKGYGSNKKKAEQNAAQKSCKMLNLD